MGFSGERNIVAQMPIRFSSFSGRKKKPPVFPPGAYFQYFRPVHPCGSVGNSMHWTDSWGGVLGLCKRETPFQGLWVYAEVRLKLL